MHETKNVTNLNEKLLLLLKSILTNLFFKKGVTLFSREEGFEPSTFGFGNQCSTN